MNILVIVAHPDDEVLGMGGTLLRHKNEGDEIYIQILTNGLYSRSNSKKRLHEAKRVAEKLNAKELRIEEFDDQKLDAYPIVNIINSIESFSQKINPEIVYTHFSGDLNKDHQITHQAVLTAFRPINKNSPLKIICAEIPSSTEWGINKFNPNYFVDISEDLEQKIELANFYCEEIRAFPHPRSTENIVNTAKKWGSHIHSTAAEAFFVEREIWQ